LEKENRLTQLKDLIQRRKRISSKELADTLFCSISTLRRDLIYLEQQGLIRRVHGEVILNNPNTVEPAQYLRSSQNLRQKKSLAILARDFIGPGMCIYLDSSTTVFELCDLIKNINNLIVLTNGLNVATRLASVGNDSIRTFIVSGEIQHNSSSVINIEFENPLIQHFNIDIAFCSASGIDNNGVYESNMNQAFSKKSVMDKAENTILLLDSSKFNVKGFFKINNLNCYKTIISNQDPPKDMVETINDNNIEWLSSDLA